MGKRGRPPHPDVLTPREWEVLSLLREGLTNAEIGERLGISADGAKYHVSEILTKLGLSRREQAAAWQPGRPRPWWAGLLAPFRGLAGSAGATRASWVALAVVLAFALAGGITLAVLLARSDGNDDDSQTVVPPVPATATLPPAKLPPEDCTSSGESHSPMFSGMQLIDEDSGWVLVATPNGPPPDDGSFVALDVRLMWTDDGGAAWRDISPPGLEPANSRYSADQAAFFLDASTGWLVAMRPRGSSTPTDVFVWRTTDGGGTWQESRFDAPPLDPNVAPPLASLGAFQFTDAFNGWIKRDFASGMMGGASFYRTSDGGATWQAVDGLVGFNGSAGPAYFSDGSSGWESWTAADNDLYVTHDGGMTWQARTLSVDGARDVSEPRFSVGFGQFPPGAGLIPMHYYGSDGASHMPIFATQDGGATWAFVTEAPVGQGPMFFSSSTTWVQATGNSVYLTEDGGATWSQNDVSWPDPFAGRDRLCSITPWELAFADEEHGWALVLSTHDGVRSEYGLVATDDGGATWRFLNP